MPTIKVVGDDETPAARKPGHDKRGEAVEFDPGAIFARFAPKPEDIKPKRVHETGEAGGEILSAFSSESGDAVSHKAPAPEGRSAGRR